MIAQVAAVAFYHLWQIGKAAFSTCVCFLKGKLKQYIVVVVYPVAVVVYREKITHLYGGGREMQTSQSRHFVLQDLYKLIFFFYGRGVSCDQMCVCVQNVVKNKLAVFPPHPFLLWFGVMAVSFHLRTRPGQPYLIFPVLFNILIFIVHVYDSRSFS